MMVNVTNKRSFCFFYHEKISIPFKLQAEDSCYLTHYRAPIEIGTKAGVR